MDQRTQRTPDKDLSVRVLRQNWQLPHEHECGIRLQAVVARHGHVRAVKAVVVEDGGQASQQLPAGTRAIESQ